jgi:hypothetical protein
VRELVLAGLLKNQFLTLGALTASFYLGCVVGSLAVAAGRVAGNGTSLADVVEFAVVRLNLQDRTQLHYTLLMNPKIYSRNPKAAGRAIGH